MPVDKVTPELAVDALEDSQLQPLLLYLLKTKKAFAQVLEVCWNHPLAQHGSRCCHSGKHAFSYAAPLHHLLQIITGHVRLPVWGSWIGVSVHPLALHSVELMH